nr:hypothetical protein [Tanacetum cinerariifolium]
NGNLVAARAEGNAAGQNGNQVRCYNCRGVGHYARNCTVRPRRKDATYLQTQLLIAQKEEAGIQLQAEEYDLMAAAADLDEIEEVNANCILMANLQQASTSGMFRINPSKTSSNEKHVPNTVKLSVKEIQKKYQPKVARPKKVGTRESLATPKPRKHRFLLRWSPTGKFFNQEGKLVDSSESKSKSNGDNACTSNVLEPKIKRFPNSTSLLDRNDHVAAILGFGQFCDSDLEVTFRRNACFIRNLEGVDLLKRDRSTNLYTINLQEMASASPIYLMARASSTKSWLWHQRLSHLNFDTINDLARNDLVAGLPKFKYHKEHLCPFCEQGKSKRASHPPKPVPNSRQRLHLLHMDLCGPMRIASINGKRYVLVIVDDYSRYTWVHFLRSNDEAPEVIIKFLKRITVLLQSPVIIWNDITGR